jgi:thioredoxin 1
MANEITTFLEFYEFISGDGVRVVDFYAQWCEPCQKFIKIWDRVETGLATVDAQIAKIDTDALQGVSASYEVSKVPTFIYFHHGREMFRHEKILTIKEMIEIAKSIA